MSADAHDVPAVEAAAPPLDHTTSAEEFETGYHTGEHRVYRIVLTGGPCGGKTTAFPLLTERLSAYGFSVFRVPEAATMLQLGAGLLQVAFRCEPRKIFVGNNWSWFRLTLPSMAGGMSMAEADADQIGELQGCIMRTQYNLEVEFERLARIMTRGTQRPCVLLCDRGLMDGKAYCDQKTWENVMEQSHLFEGIFENEAAIRDQRYDAVIHLVTAALGAERFYSTDNNTTRSETPSQAAEVDLATRRAWLGSPHLRIIGNDGGIDFETKMNMAVAAICQKLGVPGPAGTRKFFVCHSRHRDYVPADSRDFEVMHTYLDLGDSAAWVRRGNSASSLDVEGDGRSPSPPAEFPPESPVPRRRVKTHVRLTHRQAIPLTVGVSDGPEKDHAHATTATPSTLTKEPETFIFRARQIVDGRRQEHLRHLSAREYSALSMRKDPRMTAVRKRRRVFLHGSRAFEWDEVLEPAEYKGLTLISTDVEYPKQWVELPPFLDVGSDVTGDPNYLTSSLAAKTSTAEARD